MSFALQTIVGRCLTSEAQASEITPVQSSQNNLLWIKPLSILGNSRAKYRVQIFGFADCSIRIDLVSVPALQIICTTSLPARTASMAWMKAALKMTAKTLVVVSAKNGCLSVGMGIIGDSPAVTPIHLAIDLQIAAWIVFAIGWYLPRRQD